MITRDALLAALTVAGAIAGGLLGNVVWDVGGWRLLPLLAVAGALGVAVALVATRPPPVAADPGPAPEPLPDPAPPTGGGRAWWNEAPGGAVRVERPVAERHDGDRAVVAQCPRCGDFRLDVRHDGDGYAFHCRHPACGHRWVWSTGAPWPTTVVRRNLAG